MTGTTPVMKGAPLVTARRSARLGSTKPKNRRRPPADRIIVFPVGHHISSSIRLSSRVDLPLQRSLHFPARPPLHGWIQDSAEPKTDWEAFQKYGHNH